MNTASATNEYPSHEEYERIIELERQKLEALERLDERELEIEHLKNIEIGWNDFMKHATRANRVMDGRHLGKNLLEGCCDEIERLDKEMWKVVEEVAALRSRVEELESAARAIRNSYRNRYVVEGKVRYTLDVSEEDLAALEEQFDQKG